ncbi:HD-GYP domain-containing protein [Paenibacillus radicis (ex Xue et al. 2023)]|uniref:HD-GYP domain-containing protein n=1 Tax=Paenibacillus radicis (ex Xue et al. 2023) TaxID=2972489 RepID=A0ABT1YUL5_9BACL|nr:HD-GYP domain-containing protein [Paenibacillus radicis (ex Xue et al. 2023)]MCR8636359.1 HD-GYP domain-containing protein [Paenibacillus radicis (ex Xue et al. 2023)]
MRLIPISMIRPGMRLGKPIMSEEGQTLLGYQVELSQGLINKLKQMGYQQLYIEDNRTDDIYIEDAIREETRAVVRSQLIRTFQMLQSSRALTAGDRNALSKTALQCIGQVNDDLRLHTRPSDDTIMLMLMNRSSFSIFEHFFQNALNVCVYASRIGMIEGYNREDLEALSLGAMLHDIGNTQVPQNLLLKASALTTVEFEEVKKHTEHGFNLLKETPGVPLLSAHCALQHHEKINGTGYPFGLSGTGVHPFAQWVGLLDAYDAMTNPRPYRASLPPDQAIEVLFTGAGTLYDMSKVEFFRNKVAIYPVGLSVRLSTGQLGIVSKINPTFKQRPVVRILTNEHGMDLRHPEEIDLSKHLHIMIFRIGEDALVQ